MTKNVKGGDVVVLVNGQIINLENGYSKNSFKDNSIIFKKGSIGKVMGTSEDNNGEIVSMMVEFILCYGIGLRTTVLPSDIRKATNEEIHCFCGYNNQTLEEEN